MRLYLNYKEFFDAIFYSANKLKEVIKKFPGVSAVGAKTGDVKLNKLKFTGYSEQEFNFTEPGTIKIPGEGLDAPDTVTFTGESSGVWNGGTITTIEFPIPYQPVKSVNDEQGKVIISATSIGAANKADLPAKLESPSSVRFIGGSTGNYNGASEVIVNIPREPDNVYSVNNKSGNVAITAKDIRAVTKNELPAKLPSPEEISFEGAAAGIYDGTEDIAIIIPEPTTPPIVSVNGQTGKVNLTVEAVSALSEDITELKCPKPLIFTGFITGKYDGASELEINIPPESLGVTSVNGYLGAVKLNAADIGATPDTKTLKCPESLSWAGNNVGSYNGEASTFIATPSKIQLKNVFGGQLKKYKSLSFTVSEVGLYIGRYIPRDHLPVDAKPYPRVPSHTPTADNIFSCRLLGVFGGLAAKQINDPLPTHTEYVGSCTSVFQIDALSPNDANNTITLPVPPDAAADIYGNAGRFEVYHLEVS